MNVDMKLGAVKSPQKLAEYLDTAAVQEISKSKLIEEIVQHPSFTKTTNLTSPLNVFSSSSLSKVNKSPFFTIQGNPRAGVQTEIKIAIARCSHLKQLTEKN